MIGRTPPMSACSTSFSSGSGVGCGLVNMRRIGRDDFVQSNAPGIRLKAQVLVQPQRAGGVLAVNPQAGVFQPGGQERAHGVDQQRRGQAASAPGAARAERADPAGAVAGALGLSRVEAVHAEGRHLVAIEDGKAQVGSERRALDKKLLPIGGRYVVVTPTVTE